MRFWKPGKGGSPPNLASFAISVVLAAGISALCPGPSPAMALSISEEIDHLLSVVAASPCAFIRNGIAYGGAQAADHIKDKYEHYRSDVRSTEDFIAIAATRSVLSGRPYLVQCDAGTVPAAEWLKMELARLRGRS